MGFKDILKADAKVFLNSEEFGEEHIVNGSKLVLIIDNNEKMEREKGSKMADGLHRQQMLFYVSAVDFGRLPAAGMTLSIDGVKYLIIDAIREDGVYSITVEAYRSGR